MAEQQRLPFIEQIAFKPHGTGTTTFECVHPPQKVGNPANIAYGGYALATACKAAYTSVPEGYRLYSMLGHFLGPSYADRPLRASVRTVRQTRTFATRQVEISQKRDDGEDRVCLIAIADFQTREPATLLEYYRPPTKNYSHHTTVPPQADVHKKLFQDGKITQKMLDSYNKLFGGLTHIFQHRPCPEGIFSQNFMGIAKQQPTTQDHLPITSRSTAEWVRCTNELHSPADHLANLAFLIDGAISFAPLSFNKMWFDDSGAVSTLDFALRIFGDVDMRQWNLREVTTSVGGEGRTFSESWLWDEQGRAIASMSEQSILRPPPGVGKMDGKGKL